MSDHTHIQWTDATWPVVTGCEKVSQGCKGCYAIRDGWRLSHNPNPKVAKAYDGTVRKIGTALHWTGRVNLLADRLGWPLKWKAPRRIFVCNQSDLFHEDVPDGFIDQVFTVMALSPQHTFQILTKRPARMREYMARHNNSLMLTIQTAAKMFPDRRGNSMEWPFRNVWLGVSVEDQETADERIPLLLQTPAAVRFVSAEPLLGPVDLTAIKQTASPGYFGDVLQWYHRPHCHRDTPYPRLNWIIVGGESGPRARPCDVEWIRCIVAQCKAAGVPAFVKQLGARGVHRSRAHCFQRMTRFSLGVCLNCGSPDGTALDCSFAISDRKGGDPAEWPEDLRVREFPT